ncbi:MAG TPA: SusC/RagA family TonB-linked outer membrane protein [Flavipsychrobacter sp.]|nr:SusC/RagA family TonB-linked outer membrane protein [Flavipsychrobacter sp.]
MKRILLLLFLLITVGGESALAQAHLVKGRVLDENGQGFPGAGVTVKGTQTGTVTDIDGNFQLNVPDESKTLVIQAVGYGTQEVSATSANISVRLSPAAKELQGTVVTALAVRREKRELGYSATTVSNQELTAGNNVSAISALQGKVAGANITSSTGGPGGSTRVVLRGEKSILGDNNALIVVDGVIISNRGRTADAFNGNLSTQAPLNQIDFGNSANDINPEDIESVTVLEGPAAAALYGSIGANGAIMITTKTGKNRTGKKKTEITYKATYTESDILKYPDFQHKYGQGNIYDGIADDRRENFSWGLPFDGKLRPWGQIIGDSQRVKPYSDQPDNIKSFFNKAQTMENYVSLAGGSENSSYFMSIGTLNNTGVIPNTFYDKYNIRFNGSTQLSNKFYSTINVNYINVSSRVEAGGQYAGSIYDNVFETARDIPIWELKDINNVFNSMQYTDASGVNRYGYYGAYTKNPYWLVQNYDNREKTDRILGDVLLGFRPNENIDIYDRFGGDISADRAFYKQPLYSSIAFDPLYAQNPQSGPGGYEESYVNSLSLNNDLIATYKKELSDDFGFDVLGGYNMRLSNTTSLLSNIDPANNGLKEPGFYNFDNAQGPIYAQNLLIQTRSLGLYGTADFKYKNRLFLDLTARNDWTSTLLTGNNSYFYPSINTSWVFTEGMKGKFKDNILNYGKLRAGYASVGHGASAYQNNPPGYSKTQIQTGFGATNVFPFNSQPGYDIQNVIADSALRPERTDSWEVGAELSFFHNRVNITATYYYSLSYDEILTVPAAPETGFSFQQVNLGDVQNKGVELTARVTPISTPSGFKWELYGTYSQNVNKVLSLENGLSQVTLGGFLGMGIDAAVGRPIGSFYAIDLLHDPQGHVVVNGTPGTQTTGIPLATTTPVYKGTFQPRFIASWGTNLSYKGFALNLLFVTKQGGVFYSRNKNNMDFNGTAAETVNRDPQVFPNSVYVNSSGQYVTNTSIKYSPYYYYSNTLQTTIYSQALVDASYIKLQEASLYYSIPDKVLRRTPFGGLQVGVFGNNLILWTPKGNKFDDPEEGTSGVTGANGNAQGFNFTARPSLRNYGVTLKVSF